MTLLLASTHGARSRMGAEVAIQSRAVAMQLRCAVCSCSGVPCTVCFRHNSRWLHTQCHGLHVACVNVHDDIFNLQLQHAYADAYAIRKWSIRGRMEISMTNTIGIGRRRYRFGKKKAFITYSVYIHTQTHIV